LDYVDLRGLEWLNSPYLLRFLRICSNISEIRIKDTGILENDDGLLGLVETENNLLVRWD
jgi:hypothetical protein